MSLSNILLPSLGLILIWVAESIYLFKIAYVFAEETFEVVEVLEKDVRGPGLGEGEE